MGDLGTVLVGSTGYQVSHVLVTRVSTQGKDSEA